MLTEEGRVSQEVPTWAMPWLHRTITKKVKGRRRPGPGVKGRSGQHQGNSKKRSANTKMGKPRTLVRNTLEGRKKGASGSRNGQ